MGFNRKSAQTVLEEERADARPLIVRCAVPDCDWPGLEATVAECREAALAHRLERHPELAVARRPPPAKKEKPPPAPAIPKPAVARSIVAPKARATRERVGRPAPSNITAPRLEVASVAYRGGWSLNKIAARVWRDWGYGTELSCQNRLRLVLIEAGVPMRGRGQRVERPSLTADALALLVREAG